MQWDASPGAAPQRPPIGAGDASRQAEYRARPRAIKSAAGARARLPQAPYEAVGLTTHAT
jgi:hypothetical protein